MFGIENNSESPIVVLNFGGTVAFEKRFRARFFVISRTPEKRYDARFFDKYRYNNRTFKSSRQTLGTFRYRKRVQRGCVGEFTKIHPLIFPETNYRKSKIGKIKITATRFDVGKYRAPRSPMRRFGKGVYERNDERVVVKPTRSSCFTRN